MFDFIEPYRPFLQEYKYYLLLGSFLILFMIQSGKKSSGLPNNFYLIDGEYGTGKTSRAVKLIMNYLEKTNAYIFTDIRLKFENIPKQYHHRVFTYDPTRIVYIESKKGKYPTLYYNIMDMLEIMRLIKEYRDKTKHTMRNERAKFVVVLDETGAIFDKYDVKQDMLNTLYDYVVQIRKLNAHIYLISQKHDYLTLRIRTLATTVFYNEKFAILGDDTIVKGGFPWFRNLRIIRKKILDPETSQIKKIQYMETNEHGQSIMREKPMVTYQERYNCSNYWKYYDDLYMNMKQTVTIPISDESIKNLEQIKQHYFNQFPNSFFPILDDIEKEKYMGLILEKEKKLKDGDRKTLPISRVIDQEETEFNNELLNGPKL